MPTRTQRRQKREASIRVLIALPEAAERLGLCTIVAAQADMELVAQASCADETSRLMRNHHADVAVVDVGLLEPCTCEAAWALENGDSPLRLLVLVMHGKDEELQRALQVRARGILLRGMDHRDLLDAVRTVHRGHLYSPHMASTRTAPAGE